jgi:hypothetical protein
MATLIGTIGHIVTWQLRRHLEDLKVRGATMKKYNKRKEKKYFFLLYKFNTLDQVLPSPDRFLKKGTGTTSINTRESIILIQLNLLINLKNLTVFKSFKGLDNTLGSKRDCVAKEAYKEAVPKRDERPLYGLKSSKNFIIANAVENILSSKFIS